MRGPKDFDEPLTAEDLAMVKELERDLEEWFEAKHEVAVYNLNTPDNRKYPERVWREFANRARDAGWEVDYRGSVITITRPAVG